MIPTATPVSSRSDHPEPEQAPRFVQTLTAMGVLLFLAGAILPFIFAPHFWFAVTRWTGLAAIGAGGWRRPSLTYWVFFAMLLGGEIGLDRPRLAEHLRVFSDIFLRLIKVIVAPLIFGTLVTGICGHGQLGSVGRLGLKSLIYFEVLTTIALVIGLVAINVSKAGVGLNAPQNAARAAQLSGAAQLSTVPQGAQPEALDWQQFLLRIFPENIAKAVADNQILQVAV